MRISFSSIRAARVAARVFEQYGYAAIQNGREVVTDCPALLAAPAIERSLGLHVVERIDLQASAGP